MPEGCAVGYGATWLAPRPSRIATINLGYADGIARALAPHLRFSAGGAIVPAVGRISMDLIALDVTGTDIAEGDWVALDFDLAKLEAASGISQYELLTGLSRRAPRIWA
ncbi:MAG: alanine racemase C-terminal domain-containing protein [Thermaurantiacus sp.]